MLITAYCNHLTLAGMRPRTVKARRGTLEAFERRADVTLAQATRLHVEAYLARDLAAESRRTYLAALRGFYRWALDEEYLHVDPTAKVPSIRVPQGLPRPISADDLARAVLAADPRMRAWLLLMSLAGLRCMEVAGLGPDDVLEVEGSTVLHLRETKGGGSGMVPAHPEVVHALAELPVYGGRWWDVGPHTVSVTTNAFLRSLGISSTAHALRHAAGTAFFRASGHDLLLTARLLRHRSLRTTPVYVQLDPTRAAEVVNSVQPPHLRAV